MTIIEIKVPDIGDVAEVAVIELMVKPGDTIRAEQSLITVESDKASMEIPSSQAGVGSIPTRSRQSSRRLWRCCSCSCPWRRRSPPVRPTRRGGCGRGTSSRAW